MAECSPWAAGVGRGQEQLDRERHLRLTILPFCFALVLRAGFQPAGCTLRGGHEAIAKGETLRRVQSGEITPLFLEEYYENCWGSKTGPPGWDLLTPGLWRCDELCILPMWKQGPRNRLLTPAPRQEAVNQKGKEECLRRIPGGFCGMGAVNLFLSPMERESIILYVSPVLLQEVSSFGRNKMAAAFWDPYLCFKRYLRSRKSFVFHLCELGYHFSNIYSVDVVTDKIQIHF